SALSVYHSSGWLHMLIHGPACQEGSPIGNDWIDDRPRPWGYRNPTAAPVINRVLILTSGAWRFRRCGDHHDCNNLVGESHDFSDVPFRSLSNARLARLSSVGTFAFGVRNCPAACSCAAIVRVGCLCN